MKISKFQLILLTLVIVGFNFFAVIYSAGNDNSLKDDTVDNSEKFLEEPKIATYSWTTTEVVSTESMYSSGSSSIAMDNSGNVHVAWQDWTDYGGSGTDCDIFYKSWNAATGDWTTTEVVSTESTDNSEAPSIAVDGSGNVHVAWYDYSDYDGSETDCDIFYKRWNVTTGDWTTTEVVSTESTHASGSPLIAVDGSGNVHVSWQDQTVYGGSGTDRDIFYKRWNAATGEWTTTEIVSTESTDISSSPSITVDDSRNVHIAWEDYTEYSSSGTDYDIFYKRWNATTEDWTMTEVVSTESTNASWFPSIEVDDSRNVHVAWGDLTDYDSSGTDLDIFYKYWNSTMGVWTMTEVVSTESTEESYWPSIAVDSSGNVQVAWYDQTDYDGSGTDWDIFYKRWNAATGDWTTTEVVSTESTGNSNYPKIAVDGSGNVHVAWHDDTDYGGSGTDLDVFYKKLIFQIRIVDDDDDDDDNGPPPPSPVSFPWWIIVLFIMPIIGIAIIIYANHRWNWQIGKKFKNFIVKAEKSTLIRLIKIIGIVASCILALISLILLFFSL